MDIVKSAPYSRGSADNAVGVLAPVVLRLPPGHVHSYDFLLAHLTGLVGRGKATAFLLLPLPGTVDGRSSAILARPSGAAPEGLDTARFS
jgi:hypothetical protein